MPKVADRAACEEKDRKDKQNKKDLNKDPNVRKDKLKHDAEQFAPPPAAADEEERSKTRTPASERGMSDVEGISVGQTVREAQSSLSVVASHTVDLDARNQQVMVDALMPLKQDVMGVQAGQAKLDAKVDQLSKELSAVRVSHHSQRDAYTELEGNFDKVTEALERLPMQYSASSRSASEAPQPHADSPTIIGTPRGTGPPGPRDRAVIPAKIFVPNW